MARRWIIALGCAVMMLIAAAATAATPAQALDRAGVDAVHWNPDYAKKTITVTVDITFFADCDAGDCSDVTRTAAANIVAAILADWNGHKYKCWPFIVKITSRVVEGIGNLPPDSIPIRLNWSPSGSVRAYTSETDAPRAPGGMSPDDAPRPTADPDDPSEWPAAGKTSDYTHEFGHILGLDDNYDVNAPTDNGLLVARLVPGQADDAMYSANSATAHLVSEDMINRVVRRSGKVDTSKVKCDMTIDSGPTDINAIIMVINDMTLHMYTCDYDLPGDPKKPPKPMHFTGVWSEAGSLITVHGSVTVPVSFDITIPANGGTMTFDVVSTNGKTLTLSAQVTWDNDGLLRFSEPWSIDGSTTAFFMPSFSAHVTGTAPECGK